MKQWLFLVLNLSACSILYSLQLNQAQQLSRENSAENLRDLSPSSSVGSFGSLDSLDCSSVSSSIFDSKHLAENSVHHESEAVDALSVHDAQNQTEHALTSRPMEEKLAEKRFMKNLMHYLPPIVVVTAVGYGIHHNRKTKIETLTIQQQTLKAQQEAIAKQQELQQQTVQTQKNGIITSAVIAIGGILVRIFIGG